MKDRFIIFVALSIAFHVLTGGGALYVLPLLHSPFRAERRIPVGIVRVGGTGLPARMKPASAQSVQAGALPQTIAAPKPTPAKPAEAKPVPAKPNPKPAAAKTESPKPPKPKPDRKTIVVNDRNAKKPEEKKPETEQPEADFTSLLKNIAPPSKKKTPEFQPQSQPETQADAVAGFSQLLAGFSDGGDATGTPAGSPGGAGSAFGSPDGNVDADEITAWSSSVNAQFAACWNIQAGAANMKDIAVEIEVKVGADLSILQAGIVDTGRMAKDAVFRAAAERARRALLDPRCNPLPEPPLGLDITNEKVIFNFDPSAMF